MLGGSARGRRRSSAAPIPEAYLYVPFYLVLVDMSILLSMESFASSEGVGPESPVLTALSPYVFQHRPPCRRSFLSPATKGWGEVAILVPLLKGMTKACGPPSLCTQRTRISHNAFDVPSRLRDHVDGEGHSCPSLDLRQRMRFLALIPLFYMPSTEQAFSRVFSKL